MTLTLECIRNAEKSAQAAGYSEALLMEIAGAALAQKIESLFPVPGRLHVFVGKGHNGGDALIAARLLNLANWEIRLHLIRPASEMKRLTLEAWQRLHDQLQERSAHDFHHTKSGPATELIIDGILGSGSRSPLQEPEKNGIQEINSLRNSKRGCFVLSVDLPSGFDHQKNQAMESVVRADHTLCIAGIGSFLLTTEADEFTGRIHRIPHCILEKEIRKNSGLLKPASPQAIEPEKFLSWLPQRSPQFHKGHAGRVGILAGSPGMTGAAVLSCQGALRAGAGLLTWLVPPTLSYPVLDSRLPLEVMQSPVREIAHIFERENPFDALGIGPGLGQTQDALIQNILREATCPVVVDADALNALARHPEITRSLLANNPAPRLFTPHPGEMKRLGALVTSASEDTLTLAEIAQHLTQEFPHLTILMKGHRTRVFHHTLSNCPWVNLTGNPGMGVGGMGDLLTGICTALSVHLPPPQSAAWAAWACGRAAEMCLMPQALEHSLEFATQTELSLTPTDLIPYLGLALDGH